MSKQEEERAAQAAAWARQTAARAEPDTAHHQEKGGTVNEEKQVADRLRVSDDDRYRSKLGAVQHEIDEMQRDPLFGLSREEKAEAVGKRLGVTEEDRQREINILREEA